MRRLIGIVAAVVMSSGLGVIATASPAAAAYPTCNGWTTTYVFETKDWVVHSPTRGQQTNNRTCQLKQGNTGAAVKVLQRSLNYCWGDRRVGIDGEFGPATRRAVLDIQKWANNAHGGDLVEDGEFGPATREWMKFPWFRWPENTMEGRGYCDFDNGPRVPGAGLASIGVANAE